MEDESLETRIRRHPIVVVLLFCSTTAIAAWALSRELYVKPRDEQIATLEKSLNECRQTHEVQQTGSETDGTVQAATSKFDFESGVMGWQASEGPNTRGCSSVKATAGRSYEGKQSLEMTLAINATNLAKSKGEAWVKIAKTDSAGRELPINLEGRTVSAWIYAPQESYGPQDAPNGVQLFVKDTNNRSLYGPWRHVSVEEWLEIPLKVSTAADPKGHVDPGFDPTKLKLLGVKFGTGKNSRETYEGPIYLDHVDW